MGNTVAIVLICMIFSPQKSKIPSAQAFKLYDFKFDDFSLDDDGSLKVSWACISKSFFKTLFSNSLLLLTSDINFQLL